MTLKGDNNNAADSAPVVIDCCGIDDFRASQSPASKVLDVNIV